MNYITEMIDTTLMEFRTDPNGFAFNQFGGLMPIKLPAIPRIGEKIEATVDGVAFMFYVFDIRYGADCNDIDLCCVRIGTSAEFMANWRLLGWLESKVDIMIK